jgi:hypothetical protein
MVNSKFVTPSMDSLTYQYREDLRRELIAVDLRSVFAQNIAQNMSQNIAQEIAQNIAQSIAQNISHSRPETAKNPV